MSLLIAKGEEKLSTLLEGVCQVPSHLDRNVKDITMDSREAVPGSCFFAVEGSVKNGTNFIGDAINRGATAVICETQPLVEPPSKVVFLVVPKLKKFMGRISSQFFGHPSKSLNLYAVTGTNGKTTVSYLISKALGVLEGTCGYLGTLGMGLISSKEMTATANTTPDIITINRALKKFLIGGATSCALEASSIGLSQGRLDFLRIDTALYTNLGLDHLDYHGSLEAYKRAKLSLFKRDTLKKIILSLDDDFGRYIYKEVNNKEIFTVSSEQTLPDGFRADVFPSDLNYRLTGTTFNLNLFCDIQSVETQLLGSFNVSNLSLVVGALLSSGFGIREIVKSLRGVNCVPGRMQLCGKSSEGALVFLDYAHTPEGLKAALSTLRPLSRGNIYIVFGCGGDRDRSKRSEMGRVACMGADAIFLTADNSRSERTEDIVQEICGGIDDKSNTEIIYDRVSAIKAAIDLGRHGDVVLVAGKGHESFQELEGERFEYSDFLEIEKLLAETNCD